MSPPVGMKLADRTVALELLAAGFERFDVDRRLMPDQYVVFAD